MHTNMLGTKTGLGTSIVAAVIANVSQIEVGLRIAASCIGIIAGIYAILNYHFDLKRKRTQDEIKTPKPPGPHSDKRGNWLPRSRKLH